jgi:hypothetical protein
MNPRFLDADCATGPRPLTADAFFREIIHAGNSCCQEPATAAPTGWIQHAAEYPAMIAEPRGGVAR